MTDIDKLIEELQSCRTSSMDLCNKAADTIAAQQERIEELEKRAAQAIMVLQNERHWIGEGERVEQSDLDKVLKTLKGEDNG